MTVFLTSSPTGPLDGSRPVDGLDHKNRFVENLRSRWPEDARGLIVSAAPEEHDRNDQMTGFFAGALEHCGLGCSVFELWDDRRQEVDLSRCNVLLLGGGHVPTQNEFFRSIRLRERLRDFDGVVIGISAGSMNAAARVYAQPELPGEASDPHFVRWLPGLALTRLHILPHYQMVRDWRLDGQRLFEDVTYPDSLVEPFLAIPDGSYVIEENGRAFLWGEGWRIAGGQCFHLADENDITELR